MWPQTTMCLKSVLISLFIFSILNVLLNMIGGIKLEVEYEDFESIIHPISPHQLYNIVIALQPILSEEFDIQNLI